MENFSTPVLPIKTIVTLAFYVLLIMYVVFSVILYYHWQSYSMNKSATITTYVGFFGISLSLIALMGLSLLAL
jgi:hypothetical protein